MRRIHVCVTGLALLGLVPALFGASIFGPSVEADPTKDYWLTPGEGPWMIYVATFRGDPDNPELALRPQEMARRLVYELRKDYKVPAFMFNRGEEERKKEKERLEEFRRRYGDDIAVKTVRIPDEFAVLVGNYKDMDEARGALKRLKKEDPPKSVKGTGLAIAEIKPGIVRERSVDSLKLKVDKVQASNPLGKGFVAHNPLLPRQQQPKPQADSSTTRADSALADVNAREPHSLLKCQQPWTLVVMWVGDEPSRSSSRAGRPGMGETGGASQAAAEQARKLADVLRKKPYGYETYVWHTRNTVMVTVGGFSRTNDPELLRMSKQLRGLRIGDIELNPVPMEVPR